jgi:hypothetical protein
MLRSGHLLHCSTYTCHTADKVQKERAKARAAAIGVYSPEVNTLMHLIGTLQAHQINADR